MQNHCPHQVRPEPHRPLLLTAYFWIGALMALSYAPPLLQLASWLLGWRAN